jgi:Fe-S oxidoreductase
MMSLEKTAITTDNCRYCLMCRHVCPVGHVTYLETLTPHGWGLLIASERRELIEWDIEHTKVLYSCADCGTCRAHCVTDQPLPDAISWARIEALETGNAPAEVYRLKQMFQEWRNPYEQIAPIPSSGKGRTALFVGDKAHYVDSSELQSGLRILESLNIQPVLIGSGRNSGYLASSLGFHDLAKQFAESTLEELKKSEAEMLLLLDPGDFFTFTQLYEERLGVSPPEGVIMKELTVLLAEELKSGNLNVKKWDEDIPYAYIDPTHSVRTTERYDAPRELLLAVMSSSPLELFWRRERAHPVGDTALQFTNPEIAEKLTTARLEDARDSGAKLIITEDAAALALFEQRAEAYGLQVKGLYSLIAEQLVA